MKKWGVALVILILFSFSVNAFDLADLFSGLFSSNAPVITNTQANPIKVYPGQSLNILVAFEDKVGIESAVAYFPFEGGYDKIEMILSAGNEKKGTYSATWVSHNTANMKWYETKVILINKYGGETAVGVKWQDPTQDHPAEAVRPGVFGQNYNGNYSFMNGSVGIGTTSPKQKLHVVTTSTTNYNAAIFGNATGTSGITYGIFGQVNSADGYAGYFTGGKGVYTACPSGFIAVVSTDSNERQLGCINSIEDGAAAIWHDAEAWCFNTYGGRLPTSGEWYIAANSFALTDEIDDSEWVDDFTDSSHAILMGNGGITNIIDDPIGNTHPFRCWVDT